VQQPSRTLVVAEGQFDADVPSAGDCPSTDLVSPVMHHKKELENPSKKFLQQKIQRAFDAGV
jgi:hypothetical protein